jgi:signal transduction histidine kinase
VAAALNTVQDTALDLAVEQAVLRRNLADSFVNLGRRNQNLLSRQLDFITELESSETDPTTLQNLFLLDHLATRMRRNAESLLVLAGIDPPRQWAAPVGLTEVIRATLGEVEDYQRVRVRTADPIAVTGSAAADLAHMLAELVENALVFSPAGANVDIHGSTFDGGYRLAVADTGGGLPPDVVDAANRRLGGSESFTVAPSKYLGHYVAGRLAARHGIRVWLESMPGSGVIAMVDLPPHLVAEAVGPPPAPAPAGPAAAWAAPAARSRTPGPAPDLTAGPGPDLTAGAGPDLRPHRPPMAPTHKS